MIEELKFLLIHVSKFIFINLFIFIFLILVSRGYNPNKNNSNNNQMIFNPITNQPLEDSKFKQEQMKKEREKEMRELYNLENNAQMKNKEFINNKKEQIPMEYNPYKNPYSAYQGHP